MKAYQFNQYFPQPDPGKTEQELLDELREKLGLKKDTVGRRTSIQKEDEEPRYQISKLDQLHHDDMLLTNKDNLGEEEKLYGSGHLIGKELTQMIKESEDA